MGSEGEAGEPLEVIQSLREPPLTHHPVSGRPVRRIITGVTLCLRHAHGQMQNSLSRENLERHGFSRYEKTGPGSYIRTAGRDGPEGLSV